MKKFLAMLLAALMLCIGMTALAEEEKVLNIFTWEGYVDETTLGMFTEETGIQVNFQTFASNEEMLLKLQANGGSEYDIIIASDYIITAAAQEGLLMELDKSKLTNWANLDPEYLNQTFDPENAYSVPYTAGTPMIVYDPSQVEGEITCFSDLWDEQFADSLLLIDDARVMVGHVLTTLGYSFNTTDEAQLAEAAEKLNALKPNVRVLNYDMSYNYFAAGEVKAAILFTPFAYWTMSENPDLVGVYSNEGIGFGIDSMIVPVNAPHPENAYKFLDFYLRADVAAIVGEWQWYISPNAAARELMDPDYLAYSTFNIPEELYAGKQFVENIGEAASLYHDVWNNFKLS